ncbi:hypothetical protein BZL30_0408 [Mycobacterium kansasii]|uniref:DUF3558 domain-containing protein n=1 Tax=Mycobacterium kansasii TaxID=1768 RepID=A0A1V3XSQ0_MYCKA|nr:hypothetical protein BZL30_0408 [Mycobacterium kansasii]
MFAKVRLAGALGALVTAAVAGTVGWHGASASPADGSVELRSTAEPMSTTMKSPIVATTDPSPFDPCNDIPFDAVQRLGLAYTPPEAEEGLRCHYDAGNYQLAVEPITWRSYAQTLPADAIETTIAGHRAAQYWVLKPTYHNSFWYSSCMVTFKTSYGVIQQSLFYSTVYSEPDVDCPPPTCNGPTIWLRITSSRPRTVSATSPRSEQRGPSRRAGRAVPGAVGALLRLPRATTRYTVSRVHVPMRDGIHLVADHYAPATSEPVGTLLVRGPTGGLPVFFGVRRALCRARLSRGVAKRARNFRVGRRIRTDGQRSGRRCRHRRVVAAPTVVHRPVRNRRPLILGFHSVGAAARSAAGAGRGRHHRGATRFPGLGVGHRIVCRQRLLGLELSGFASRRIGAAARRDPPATGAAQGETCHLWDADELGGPDTARRGRTLVRILGTKRRPRSPLLGITALSRRVGPR